MLLLRKASLGPAPAFHILPGATAKMVELAPLWDDAPQERAASHILEEIQTSVEDGHVFENPARAGQYIVYGELGNHALWFVVAPNDPSNSRVPDATHIVVTVLMHKDKHFREELAAVEQDITAAGERCG